MAIIGFLLHGSFVNGQSDCEHKDQSLIRGTNFELAPGEMILLEMGERWPGLEKAVALEKLYDMKVEDCKQRFPDRIGFVIIVEMVSECV